MVDISLTPAGYHRGMEPVAAAVAVTAEATDFFIIIAIVAEDVGDGAYRMDDRVG